jgi:hypothetical protein
MFEILADKIADVWPDLMNLALGFHGVEDSDPISLEESSETLDKVINLCASLGWEDLERQAKRLLQRIANGATGEPIATLATDFRDGFHEKLQAVLLLVIEDKDQKLFVDAISYFGIGGVADKLASSAEEFNLAGRALAVSLSTACVFHAMRAIEVSLHILAKDLDIDFPAPIELQDWANLTQKISSFIEQLEPQRKSQDKANKLTHFSELMIPANGFRLAWRNHVAHAREKYEYEEARRVIGYVGDYLKTLSEAM